MKSPSSRESVPVGLGLLIYSWAILWRPRVFTRQTPARGKTPHKNLGYARTIPWSTTVTAKKTTTLFWQYFYQKGELLLALETVPIYPPPLRNIQKKHKKILKYRNILRTFLSGMFGRNNRKSLGEKSPFFFFWWLYRYGTPSLLPQPLSASPQKENQHIVIATTPIPLLRQTEIRLWSPSSPFLCSHASSPPPQTYASVSLRYRKRRISQSRKALDDESSSVAGWVNLSLSPSLPPGKQRGVGHTSAPGPHAPRGNIFEKKTLKNKKYCPEGYIAGEQVSQK